MVSPQSDLLGSPNFVAGYFGSSLRRIAKLLEQFNTFSVTEICHAASAVATAILGFWNQGLIEFSSTDSAISHVY